MQRSNLSPLRHPVRLPPDRGRWLKEIDEAERCLSCAGLLIGDDPFCDDCRSWSRRAELSEWDDLGAAD